MLKFEPLLEGRYWSLLLWLWLLPGRWAGVYVLPLLAAFSRAFCRSSRKSSDKASWSSDILLVYTTERVWMVFSLADICARWLSAEAAHGISGRVRVRRYRMLADTQDVCDDVVEGAVEREEVVAHQRRQAAGKVLAPLFPAAPADWPGGDARVMRKSSEWLRCRLKRCYTRPSRSAVYVSNLWSGDTV
jgi:hypothetical protein